MTRIAGQIKSAGRNASVDMLRFIGAVGIVLFHTALPGAWIGLAALPMFVVLAVYYGLDRPLHAHARRLLIPWVIWSAIFGVAKLCQSTLSGTSVASEFAPWMVLTGLSLHLWFLPFVFLFLAFAYIALRKIAAPVLWGVSISVSILALFAANTALMPTPLPQWCSVIPAAFAGVLMVRTGQPLAVLAGLAAASFFAIGVLDWQIATWQLLIAALATLLALGAPLAQSQASLWASNVSLGIYLVHPLIYAVALYVLPRYSWPVFVVTVIGSLLATMALRRTVPRIV